MDACGNIDIKLKSLPTRDEGSIALFINYEAKGKLRRFRRSSLENFNDDDRVQHI